MDIVISIGEDLLYGTIAVVVGYLCGYLHRDVMGQEVTE